MLEPAIRWADRPELETIGMVCAAGAVVYVLSQFAVSAFRHARLNIVNSLGPANMARLVSTHSTYIPGLLKVLERLAKSQIIGTIIPGRIYTAQSSIRTGLELRLTTATKRTAPTPSECTTTPTTVTASSGSTSQKVVARALTGVQEIFLVYPTGSFTHQESLRDHLKHLLRNERCTIILQNSKDRRT